MATVNAASPLTTIAARPKVRWVATVVEGRNTAEQTDQAEHANAGAARAFRQGA
ncbi:MAG: hypothetical protein QF726_09390 [Alphaproteobacteria bacterium]|nr:hypothetical protein [Alphaproteobacteria bacterium]